METTKWNERGRRDGRVENITRKERISEVARCQRMDGRHTFEWEKERGNIGGT